MRRASEHCHICPPAAGRGHERFRNRGDMQSNYPCERGQANARCSTSPGTATLYAARLRREGGMSDSAAEAICNQITHASEDKRMPPSRRRRAVQVRKEKESDYRMPAARSTSSARRCTASRVFCARAAAAISSRTCASSTRLNSKRSNSGPSTSSSGIM